MKKSLFPTQDEHETGFSLQKRCFPSIICNHDHTNGKTNLLGILAENWHFGGLKLVFKGLLVFILSKVPG